MEGSLHVLTMAVMPMVRGVSACPQQNLPEAPARPAGAAPSRQALPCPGAPGSGWEVGAAVLSLILQAPPCSPIRHIPHAPSSPRPYNNYCLFALVAKAALTWEGAFLGGFWKLSS